MIFEFFILCKTETYRFFISALKCTTFRSRNMDVLDEFGRIIKRMKKGRIRPLLMGADWMDLACKPVELDVALACINIGISCCTSYALV